MKKENQELEKVQESEPVNVLAKIKISELIDVSTWKEKQNKLVVENPFFKITDSKTYEAGKKHRTNIVKGRTELQNQEKLIASNFAAIRKEVGNETSTLIEITQPLEDKWQAEVKAWEERREREKQAEKEAEDLRVKTIKDKIEAFETDSYTIIQKMTFEKIEEDKGKLAELRDDEFDFAEYDVLFDQVMDRVTAAFETKVESLTASENQRLRNLELEKENAEVKRKSDLQASRLTEIMPYVAFGVAIDLAKLSEMDNDEYEGHLSSKKGLFEADEKSKAVAEKVRLEKETEEKDAIYDIRAKRLEEAGMIYSDEHNSFWTTLDPEFIILEHDIYTEGPKEFEDTLVEVKSVIEREQRKLAIREERKMILQKSGIPLLESGNINFKYSENRWFTVEEYQIFNSTQDQFDEMLKLGKEALFKVTWNPIVQLGYTYNAENNSFEMEGFNTYPAGFLSDEYDSLQDQLNAIEFHVKKRNEELAEADAAKLKSENKARIAKYSGDKKALTKFVKSLEFRGAVPELENEDMQPVLDNILLELENARGLLLTSINLF